MISKIVFLVAVCTFNVHFSSAASCHAITTVPTIPYAVPTAAPNVVTTAAPIVVVTTPAACQAPTTTAASCQAPVTIPPIIPSTTTSATTTPQACMAPTTVPPVSIPPTTTTPSCVEPQAVTNAPVTLSPITRPATTEPECIPPPNKVLLLTNKGGYTAVYALSYHDPNHKNTKSAPELIVQKGTIMLGQTHTLSVPWNVDYADSQYGARLSVFAIAGKQVINDYKIKSEKQCVHIYGTTLDTKWSPIDC